MDGHARVAVVDDDHRLQTLIQEELIDEGVQPVPCTSGEELLELIKHDHVDLILLDLMMPVKSGIALLSDLKKDDALKEIPVIMVTGVSGETGIDLEAFLKKGAATGLFWKDYFFIRIS